MNNTHTHSDRISRAWEIILAGDVRPGYRGRWFAQSQSINREYEVGEMMCECPDSAEFGNICKHQLAGPASLITLAAISFRNDARNEEELHRLGLDFAARLRALPSGYVEIARREYRARLIALRSAARLPIAA